MIRKALIVLSLIGTPVSAHPLTYGYNSGTTGDKLMQVCGSQIWTPGKYDPCGSYLLGLIDGLAIAGAFCPRSGVQNHQLEQIAFNAVRDQPQRWDMPAISLIWGALAKEFPCVRRK